MKIGDARHRGLASCVLGLVVMMAVGAPPPGDVEWLWPLAGSRIEREFLAPAHDYAAGHRGVDLRVGASRDVLSPSSGVVAFAGTVVDRGILTIDHGDGLVTTLEPVTTTLSVGEAVRAGDVVAHLSTGGHTAAGVLHVGLRLHGDYINPMLFLGGVPRAVLLPCCDAID